MALRYTLRADGPTDVMLMPILRWVLEQLLPNVEMHGQFANPKTRPHGVSNKLVPSIRFALEYYPCDLLFIHRDAEAESLDAREREIETAIEEFSDEISIRHIAIIPVRMSEAWLLIEESAIRRASGNPNGKTKISLPKLREVENVTDPKAELHTLLRIACEHTGRRLKSFRPEGCIPLIAEYISDYSPLQKLPAFQQLHKRMTEYCQAYRHRTHDASDT